MHRVSPHDVCDVIPAEPLVVNAMPRARFIDRLRLSYREREASYGPHLSEPAQVMWVTKDKWARVDAVHVRFIDQAYNHAPGPLSCSVSDASRQLLNIIAKRDRLPVVKYGDRPSLCAVHRMRKEHLSARKRVGAFMQSTLTRSGGVALPSDA